MANEKKVNELAYSNGSHREEFEDFIRALKYNRYSLKIDEHGEYEQTVVFHMWTGFCIALEVKNGTANNQ